MGNILVKAPKLEIIRPEVADVYFAKKIEQKGNIVFEKIKEAHFGDKVYIVNDLSNLSKYKIKIQIFEFIQRFLFGGTESFVVQQNGKDTNTIILENELVAEVILAPNDKLKRKSYEKRLKDKPIEFFIKVIAENKEYPYAICYNLKEYKYDYKNPPNFWYTKEGNRFLLKAKEENTMYITRKWEKWTGQNKNSATYGTFVFGELTGFICEPYGPETTKSGTDKRIPEGTYNLEWYPKSGRFPKNVYTKEGRYAKKSNYKIDYPELKNGIIRLYNEKVSKNRGILFHAGYDGDWTEGCINPLKQINQKKRDKNIELSESIDIMLEIYDKIEKIGIEKVKIVIKDEINTKKNEEDEKYGEIIKKRTK